jgi:hypothetical protein
MCIEFLRDGGQEARLVSGQPRRLLAPNRQRDPQTNYRTLSPLGAEPRAGPKSWGTSAD